MNQKEFCNFTRPNTEYLMCNEQNMLFYCFSYHALDYILRIILVNMNQNEFCVILQSR